MTGVQTTMQKRNQYIYHIRLSAKAREVTTPNTSRTDRSTADRHRGWNTHCIYTFVLAKKMVMMFIRRREKEMKVVMYESLWLDIESHFKTGLNTKSNEVMD